MSRIPSSRVPCRGPPARMRAGRPRSGGLCSLYEPMRPYRGATMDGSALGDIERFGIGQPVRRSEDPRCLTGAGIRPQLRCAAEMIDIDYKSLPAIVDLAAAARPGAPLLYPERGSNRCVHWESHEESAVIAAFADAHTVVALDFVNNRVVGSP